MTGLLLRGARLVDLDGAGPDGGTAHGSPRDVRVADGVIVEVAPSLAPAGDEEVVDAGGRWAVPGLWDAHVHMAQWGLVRRRLDVSAASSAAEVTRLVVDRLRTVPRPPGAMVVAAGFRDALWPDEPTSALLDRALAGAGLPPSPVVVVSGDLHCAWLSTPALERLGHAGHPTGVVREEEWLPLMAVVDDVPVAELDTWVDEAARAAAARGVVGVVDMEIDDNLASWRRREEAGTTSLRVLAAVWREHLDAAVGRGLTTGDAVDGSALVRLGPLKVIADGSLNTRTAWCHDPYPDRDRGHGVLSVAPDELAALLGRAARHGIAGAVHAIGDAAVGAVLDAFEASGARGSVEHAQLVTAADVARMARLGVVASVQPEHAMDDRDVAERYWAGRTGSAFPLADLLRAGVPLTFGSDAPVAPLDPWAAIDSAVHRSRDGRDPWHPEQRVDVRAALRASVRSRIAPGEPADLVLVEADPCAEATGLRRMPVAATLLAGRWTHLTI